ncbi:MAG: LysE family translocator [Rhizobiaceae bacterium]|nr:LysE family translocator [Rhizobiaceae bacterium]
MTFAALLTFAIASFFIAIVPGPTVTVIVANSLRHGTKAGLLNILGTQIGVFMMMLIVAFSLDTVIAVMAQSFFWLKLAGAGYLIWLGIKMLRSDGSLALQKSEGGVALPKPKGGFILQGFIVICSNPKALVLFGAFIPQFVGQAEDAFSQTMILGLIFMTVATVFDCLYALLAGGAGAFLTKTRVRLVERMSGVFLICGGIWLATLKRA